MKKLSFAQNASFNTAGSLINAFCLWLTTLVVVRIGGNYSSAGIWQLTISLSNVFVVIAGFNLSTYFVSDVKGEHKTEDYFGTQVVTCVMSVILAIVYSFVCGYRGLQLYCIAAYMLSRSLDALADLLYGIDQRNYRMDFVGVSAAIRGILQLVLFSVTYYFWRNPALSALSSTIVSIVVLCFYDMPCAKKFGPINYSFETEKIKAILKFCVWSVLATTSFMAISVVPRQFLQDLSGQEAVGYYSTISSPLVVIQLISIGIMSPILRDVALLYNEHNIKKLKNISLKVLGLLAVFTVLSFAGMKLVGSELYVLLYGENIFEYCYLAYAIIICTVLYAACWVMRTMLIVMRSRKPMFLFAAVSLVFSAIPSSSFINRYGLNGVSFSIILAYSVFLLLSLTYVTIKIKVWNNGHSG